jgi:hypothetical protein
MNTFNVLIVGNFDNDIRGDSALYLLSEVAPYTCNVYFTGTGSTSPSASYTTPVDIHLSGVVAASGSISSGSQLFYSGSGSTVYRNPSFYGKSFNQFNPTFPSVDISYVSAWTNIPTQSVWSYTSPTYLITPRHVLTSTQFATGIGQSGSVKPTDRRTITFVGPDNVVYTKTVVSASTVWTNNPITWDNASGLGNNGVSGSTDYTVYLLDSAVTASISPVKILPVNVDPNIITALGTGAIPIYKSNQDLRQMSVGVSYLLNLNTNFEYQNIVHDSSNVNRNSTWQGVTTGDAGNPIFIQTQSGSVALGHITYLSGVGDGTGGMGKPLFRIQNEINGVINLLSPSQGYSVTTSSLAYQDLLNEGYISLNQHITSLGWSGNHSALLYTASISTAPSIDCIILHALNGDWNNHIDGVLSASNVGIPVFTQHYNDVSQSVRVGEFYGFAPSMNIGWGGFTSNNSGSYGPELEFFDTAIEGSNLSASILLYGDSSGLLETENFIYLDNNDVGTNELNAVASTTGKYLNLIQALSSSFSTNVGGQNYNLYTNYNNYLITNNTQLRKQFNFDIRQYLRQASSFYSSSWTPTEGYGMIQIRNLAGSSQIMPNLTSSFNYTNLGVGTPLYINVTGSNAEGIFIFSWVNFAQSGYQSTKISINGITIYEGSDSTFTWTPNITTTNAVVTFQTTLINGLQSYPELNSIITLGPLNSESGVFSKLWYGYSCATNGTYVAISSVNNKFGFESGIVDILVYNPVTNTYENSFLIKKLINPSNYSLILTAEDNTIDVTGSSDSGSFITTETSSSYSVYTQLVVGTEQSGSTEPHQELQTESGIDLYADTQFLPISDDPLDLEVESVLNLITFYSDNFGKSLSLFNNLLAVGCPETEVIFTNGQLYVGGSVEIFDLSMWVAGQPYYSTASLSIDNDVNFGESVSFSQLTSVTSSLFLAVGSSTAFAGYGAVYIYMRSGGDSTAWDLKQTIYGPTSGSFFGGSVKFEQSGMDYTLVVGNSNKVNNQTGVYIYNYYNGTWTLSTTLYPNDAIPQTLPYLNNAVPIILPNNCDGFGNSVAIYGNNIVVGAPTDTVYLEFLGGNSITRGAVYFYNRCSPTNNYWQFVQKSWGDHETLVNNNFGFSVDMYNDMAIVAVPKNNVNLTANYIVNTLYKKFDCNPNDSYFNTLGQVILYEYDTSSSLWDVYYTQQKIKDYGYPYLNYGYCVAIYNQIFVVGAPCFISDYQLLTVNFNTNIQGYSYIYNLNNLVSNIPVGNVFYRDGVIILSNSGSIFDSLMKNKYDNRYSYYDLSYNSAMTLHEKQIVCTINPGEFNYSTNPTSLVNNSYFNFQNIDLMLKYISSKVNNGDVDWWNYLNFNVVEQSLFNMYTENYNIYNNTINPYITSLSSSYASWDVDGNSKINKNDMTLIWKYFTNTLTQNDVFACVEPKSTRKTLTAIQNYIETVVIVQQYGQINPLFFQYDYSSSIDRTGSYLAPYITAIGLYNGSDMVGVAKLAKPIKNGGEFPLNILVKWDF